MGYLSCLISLFVLAAAVADAKDVDCMKFPHKRVVKVKNTQQLDRAIRKSKAGDLILMARGKYSSVIKGGNYRHLWFENKRGTRKNPITLCGPRGAYLDGRKARNYVMRIYKSRYINIAGITIQNGLKGIIIQKARRCKIDGCMVRNFGKEAIHIQYKSHHNTIIRNTILNTGRESKGNGEGVYLGSDDQRGKDPNTRNHILYNTIGPGVTAEMIDIKQYSSNAIIKGNILDGKDLCGCKHAFSLISVKGNNYKILGNIGKNSKKDMFKVAVTNKGQGKHNYFAGNKCKSGLKSKYKCVSVPIPMHNLPNRVKCGQKTNTRCIG